jgi:putative intracellular protease/amidase
MKIFADFLTSLSEVERNYLAHLDNERDVVEHREQLDALIAAGGYANLDSQHWYPYEVIDLGKHFLENGQERVFVACNGIVLLNISTGEDKCNDIDYIIPNFRSFASKIPEDLVAMIEALGQLAT